MSGSLFQLLYANDATGARALLFRDGSQTAPSSAAGGRDSSGGSKLSKQDINKRDPLGRTALHLAASKGLLDFVKVLLENQGTDVNLLDSESGWSALHRALYHGRIACAQYIIATRGRDTIKTKDRESNSPFDVLNSTLNGTNPPPLYEPKGGSDLFTFGSNKNNTLGFGDGDDRSHPEKVQINRPARKDESPLSQFRPSRIRDVQMAKMHTAILTTDPRDNLYICGFNGTSGRLGLLMNQSNQSSGTQFTPKPVQGIGDEIVAIALGQDHTVALTKSGAIWTWGSNQHGQLGYALDLSVQKDNVQKVPRKITTLKKIEVKGIATSNLHSVCFSDDSLYTWGLNRGQLGYSSGDDEPIQTVPKKVSSLPAPVEMVTAIDHATICLLKTKVVTVIANNGSFRVQFPLDRFADNVSGLPLSSVFRPRQMYAPNIITKVTSGGSTICAVSSMGDVFSFSLADISAHTKAFEIAKKMKPQRIWSLRRRHMAVRDVAVGQDGTVIISTESGSVWTRIRRTKPKIGQTRVEKEYKFARVANLTRVVAVRANNVGAYAAIRNDVDLKEIEIEESTLAEDLLMSTPLGEDIEEFNGEGDEEFETDSDSDVDLPAKEREVDILKPWSEWFTEMSPSESCDAAFVVRGGQRIYFHKTMLVCRSPAFHEFLTTPGSALFTLELTSEGVEINLQDIGIVAAAQLIHYLYTDKLLNLPELRDSHKHERLEMIKELKTLASRFKLKALSDIFTSSWYIALTPTPTLQKDLKGLRKLPSNLTAPDVVLCLADREVPCHSFILAARCPFFQAMLDTAGLGGGWVATRRQKAFEEGQSNFKIQLKHIPYGVMTLVLEYIYCDAGSEIFMGVRKESVDDFLEFVIEIMAVANELLLDRLKDVCQSVLARFVNLRNVATILEEAATYAAEQLKDACLDYCAINAEALLENRLLDDLDPDLMEDLEVRVRAKQVERLPISRGEILLSDLAARYPTLEEEIQEEREARQFASALGTSLPSSISGSSVPSTPLDWKRPPSRPSTGKKGKKGVPSATNSPVLRPTASDLMFDMDDLDAPPPPQETKRSPIVGRDVPEANPWRDVHGKPLKEQPPVFTPNQKFRVLHESVSAVNDGQQGWSEVGGRGKREGIQRTAEPPKNLQMTPMRASPHAGPSTSQTPVSATASPTPPAPGASPWKKTEPTLAIPFKSVLQEAKNTATLSSTFPPSTQTKLPERPTPKPATTAARPRPTGPVYSSDGTSVRRNSATTATAACRIHSVPGKSFQTPSRPSQPAPTPDMFPALGASPQNLSEIMAEQKSEQKALSAKAVPRSLKEIQEEEKFLQWWEAESARVREEEEAVARMKEESLRGSQRGRGRGRGRGQGHSGGRGRGRGDVRGRGEGSRGRDDGMKGRDVNSHANRSHLHNSGK